jgi:pimeloyl-ACP methyl ester carboxylesterase
MIAFDASVRARNAKELTIRTADGIDWGGFVTIGGVPEWLRIRGQHRSNPVLLILHGGPSDAQSELTKLYAPLEQDFVVVQWDQRGAGRTFGRGVRLTPDTPYERLVEDGLEVTEFALHRLNRPKLILLGHSLGSVLGVHMVKRRPDLFYAFVATGFIVAQSGSESVIYRRLLNMARKAHDASMLATLEQVGPPPYRSLHEYLPVDDLIRNRFGDASDRAFWGLNRTSEPAYVLTSPELTPIQMYDWYRATMTTIFTLPYPPADRADIRPLGYEFKVPVFIIQGENDWNTPAELALSYFQRIQAPYKKYIPLPGGHWAAMTHMARFRDLLVTQVLPAISGLPPAQAP